jgi:hypothetical protein
MKFSLSVFCILLVVVTFGQLHQELLLPHTDHVTNSTSYLFQWNRNPTVPNQYWFQFSTDSTFTSNIIDDTTNAGSYFVNNLGPSNTRYFWRVKALNPATSWSWVRRFTYFNPNNLNGLVAWLNPSAGVSLSGTSVLGMTDQGVFNNNAFQSVLAQRPTFVASDSIMNNQPSIKYDGSNDFIEMSDSPALDFTTEFTAHALVKPEVVAVNKTILAKWDYQTQGSWVWQTEFATADEYMFTPCFTVTDPGNQKVVTNNADMVAKKPTLMTLTYNANILARATYHKNLNLLTTSIIGTIPQFLPNSTATLKVGKYGGTATRYYHGDITEILLFNHAQTDTLRNLVDHYLRFKYCPPVNLGPDTIISPTGNCGNIQVKADYRFSTYLWSTGSTASRIFVQQPGTYWVTVTDFMGNISRDTIRVYPPYSFNTPSSSVVCQGQSLTWTTNFPTNGYQFQWQNGATTPSMLITQAGAYHVKVTDNNGCFVRSDTLHVTIDNYPTTAFLGADTSACIGNAVGLQIGASSTVQYLWHDNSTNSTFLISTAGPQTISLQSTNINGCVAYDTMQVNVAGYAPVVSLTLPSVVCTNAPIMLSSVSTVNPPGAIQSTAWALSNGITATVSSLQFTEGNPGQLLGTVTVTATDNCTTTLPLSLLVSIPPNLGVTHAGICSNAPVSFAAIDSSGAPLASCHWQFSSGTTDTSATPSTLFNTSGTVSATLIAQNNTGCSDTIMHSLQLSAAPSAQFSYANTCEKSDISLTNTSISNDTSQLTNYAWDFGDTTNAVGNAPLHAYAQEGTYTISMVVHASNTCTDTATLSIDINPKPDLAWNVGSACIGNNTIFQSLSTIPTGTIDSTSWLVNLQFPFEGLGGSYVFTTLGIQYLHLNEVSNLGCESDTLILVHVIPGVVSAFTLLPETIVAGDTMQLASQSMGQNQLFWYVNQEFIDSVNAITVPVADSLEGNFISIVLVAENGAGCVDTSEMEVLVNERIMDIEVKQVFHSVSNGLDVVGAELFNHGTIPISRANVELSLSGEPMQTAYFNDTLLPGNSYYYVFPSSPNFTGLAQNDIGDYYCVRADLTPFYNQAEIDLENNFLCEMLEEQTFELGFPFPNPSNEECQMTLVLSENAVLQIDVYNAIGQKHAVILPQQEMTSGTYPLKIDMRQWPIGSYFLRASSNSYSRIYQLIKTSK